MLGDVREHRIAYSLARLQLLDDAPRAIQIVELVKHPNPCHPDLSVRTVLVGVHNRIASTL